MRSTALATLLLMTSSIPTLAEPAAGGPQVLTAGQIREHLARFAPVDLAVDLRALPAGERQALGKLVQAAQVLDGLYLRQVWSGNGSLLAALAKDTSPLGQLRLKAFLLNAGPWNRLDASQAFLPGIPPKPAQASYYPQGATKAEVEAWLKGLPKAERAVAEGYFTVIRRAPDGKLQSLPYSVAYQAELERAAALLREAAALTAQPTLQAFLTKRADAFLSNDYYESDVAWMELDASIEPTIGPYEVYEDEWFNAKAAFEAFITVRDDAQTQQLARFSAELQDIEDHLPIDARYKNPKLGALAPIRVVNSLFGGGEANRGVQTAAFNLPNDERITAEKGAKRVMLRNVQEAKFQKVLLPISRVALAPADRKQVAFDVFFTHILMHELMHGLGPHHVTRDGQQTTVRAALQDTYSFLEEAKADISGLFAMQYLIDKGVLDQAMERTMYTTFLASAFRSIRFGLGEAHGKGVALQLNTLLDKGAVKVARDGTFSVDMGRMKPAVTELTHELLTLQAEGDRARARELLDRMGVVRPEVARVLAKLEGVPVDILPRFVTAEQLLAQGD